jgi:hypothetical protein
VRKAFSQTSFALLLCFYGLGLYGESGDTTNAYAPPRSGGRAPRPEKTIVLNDQFFVTLAQEYRNAVPGETEVSVLERALSKHLHRPDLTLEAAAKLPLRALPDYDKMSEIHPGLAVGILKLANANQLYDYVAEWAKAHPENPIANYMKTATRDRARELLLEIRTTKTASQFIRKLPSYFLATSLTAAAMSSLPLVSELLSNPEMFTSDDQFDRLQRQFTLNQWRILMFSSGAGALLVTPMAALFDVLTQKQVSLWRAKRLRAISNGPPSKCGDGLSKIAAKPVP